MSVTFGSRTMTLIEWSEALGIPRDTIYDRHRRGAALDGSDKQPATLDSDVHPDALRIRQAFRESGMTLEELARRWRPILDFADDNGITFGYELHPGSDLYDGATYERFLDKTDDHAAACLTYDPSHFLLQQLNYVEFIRLYHDRIKAFHVKDAEFRPDGRVGVYGGYEDWNGRAGRFRSLGDGQVDFGRIFSLLTSYGFDGWAILEWECCVKSPEQGKMSKI